MGDFVDELKERRDTALQRFQRSQQQLNVAQMEHNAATQEYNSWHFAWQAEVRRLALKAAAALAARQVGPPSPSVPTLALPTSISEHSEVPDVNKTELVRNVLRQNPNGITPTEIGKALKNQDVATAYVYSVLKRLKDRDEVAKRRGGKYYLKQNSQEQEQTAVEVAANNGAIALRH